MIPGQGFVTVMFTLLQSLALQPTLPENFG